jgi:pSer/pThr/pTyr-binding forkhead associated (FHA) protein
MLVTLRCTNGPLAGEVITVESELVLGRILPEPGNLGGDLRLSRRHARIFADGSGNAVIEDLGSTNGTWANDARLSEPHVLCNGDELRLGQSCFAVELPLPPAPTEYGTDAAAGAPTIGDRPAPTPSVRVVAGPSAGQEVELGNGLLIGRSYGEPGALGGDSRLSRRHARIAREPGGAFFIEDTGSTNGTLLNGEQLRGAQPLRSGDEIKVGASTLVAAELPSAASVPELEKEPDPRKIPVAGAPAPPPPVPAGPGAFEPQGAAGARFSSRRVTAVFASVFAVSVLAAAGAVVLAAPLGSRACPDGFICHKPPTAAPLRALTTFAGSLGWRLEYDPQLVAPSKADAAGNQLVLEETAMGDRSLGAASGSKALGISVRGYPASSVSAQAAMQSMVNQLGAALVGATTAPNSDQMFGVPVLGLHRAIGEVLEGDFRTPQGPGGLVKVAVLAASSGPVTVVAAAYYLVRRGTSQDTNPNEQFDRFADQVLETVRFPSDGRV